MPNLHNIPSELQYMILSLLESLPNLRRATMVCTDLYAAFHSDKARILAAIGDDGPATENPYFISLTQEGRFLVVETWINVLDSWNTSREHGARGSRFLKQEAIDAFQDLNDEDTFSAQKLFDIAGEVYVNPSISFRYFVEELLVPAHARGKLSELTSEELTTLRLWKRFTSIGKDNLKVSDDSFGDLIFLMRQTWNDLEEQITGNLTFELALHCYAVDEGTIARFNYTDDDMTDEAAIANAAITHYKEREFYEFLATHEACNVQSLRQLVSRSPVMRISWL
ncbi:hypothetical protein EJ08DRAFT_356071 [Tothia fuscella]|uniref:F-box domain-containing protein n=1 Tax=Tothia fuscella TaxID=1048955 RepID=A0A9P4NMI8_9PEZI|nr:hypothetical protein EJ08DRAFT_356071 [Tothia fuscella]